MTNQTVKLPSSQSNFSFVRANLSVIFCRFAENPMTGLWRGVSSTLEGVDGIS